MTLKNYTRIPTKNIKTILQVASEAVGVTLNRVDVYFKETCHTRGYVQTKSRYNRFPKMVIHICLKVRRQPCGTMFLNRAISDTFWSDNLFRLILHELVHVKEDLLRMDGAKIVYSSDTARLRRPKHNHRPEEIRAERGAREAYEKIPADIRNSILAPVCKILGAKLIELNACVPLKR